MMSSTTWTLDDFFNDDGTLIAPTSTQPTAQPITHDPIPTVPCSDLLGMCFTILSIESIPQPNDQYHFFKWLLTVRDTDTGKHYRFLLNPAKARNAFMARLQKELPVSSMTVVQKTFTEQREFKLITYYEVTNYTEPASGTISH